MGILSRLFGRNQNQDNIRKRPNQPDVVDIQSEDEKMNWAMNKSRLTLHHFKGCLKLPKPNQQYFSIKVKLEDEGKVEHIWLTEPNFDNEGNLFGIVGNEPIDVKTVQMNQKIGINEDLISDWMIIENGRLIGGYTIRAVRDNLSGKALQNFDKSLGGMIVDAGEDHFLPDDSTPEGAIVKIEHAFNEDNIEKAIQCKDFKKEAELMLSKIDKGEMVAEVIDKTAEVLKLSFIKSLQENGIPKFNNIKQAFPKREKINSNHMIITEVCYYPDGSNSNMFSNLFTAENITFSFTQNFRKAQWEKLIESSSMGSVQVLRGKSNIIFKEKENVVLLEQLIDEAMTVAESEEIIFDEFFKSRLLEKILSYPKTKGSSMLTDYFAGNPLELNAKLGAILSVAQKHDIHLPYSENVFEQLKIKAGK